MMDILQYLDAILFHWINQDRSGGFFDFFLILLRNKLVWIPLYIFLSSFLLINFKKRGLIIILFALGTVVISDSISSKIIKPMVQRTRPCNDLSFNDNVRLLVHCGSGYSFTSSHAVNHFGLAVFLMMMLGEFLKRKRFLFLLWAASIAYAQVYVGVHYPLDVICGAFLGSLIGYSMGRLCNRRIFFVEENW